MAVMTYVRTEGQRSERMTKDKRDSNEAPAEEG